MEKTVVLYNPLTQKALAFESISSAATYLNVDPSTVSRAVSGDRGRWHVAGWLPTQAVSVAARG